MKKFLYLFLCSLPLLFATACSDDDDAPDVSINLEISGGVVSNGTIYGVADSTLTVDAIEVVNHDGKTATLANVFYFWDGIPMGPSPAYPYGYEMTLPEAPGDHVLSIEANLLVVDKPIYNTLLRYRVTVVESEEQLPEGTNTREYDPVLQQAEPDK